MFGCGEWESRRKRRVAGRMFFFEKKNQKTFDFWRVAAGGVTSIDKSFLRSFFNPENAFSLGTG
jgi:hypothetical protein